MKASIISISLIIIFSLINSNNCIELTRELIDEWNAYSEDTIYLEYRNLTSIAPGTFSDAVTRYPNLNYVRLGNNQFTTIKANSFVGLSHIRYLWLYNNSISELEPNALVGLDNIYQIQLYSNKLNVIKSYFFKNISKTLAYLSLGFNGVEKIEPTAFSELSGVTDMGLNNNNLVNVDPLGLNGLVNIQRFYLQQNRIRSFDDSTFNSFHSIKRLEINTNQITSISANLFSRLSTIEEIDLSRNNIISIDRNAFVGLVNLRTLKLYDNPIVIISPSYVETLCSTNPVCTIELKGYKYRIYQ